jgi:hypothetical protein
MKRLSILFLFVFGLSDVLWAQDEVQITPKFRPAYFCEISTGMLSVGDFKGFAHVKNGFSLSPHLDLSFGLGVEGHTTGRYLPIFLEGRYNFFKGKTRPFVAVNAGYLQVIEDWTYNNWNTENNKHLGFTGTGRIGVQHQFASGLSIVSSVGYRFTRVQYEQRNDVWLPWPEVPVEPNATTMIHHMNRFELSVGLIFK